MLLSYKVVAFINGPVVDCVQYAKPGQWEGLGMRTAKKLYYKACKPEPRV